MDAFLIDARGNRLGYSEETGGIAKIPGSIWFGGAGGIGWNVGPVDGPLVLEVTGVGEDYYVQVSTLNPAGLSDIENEGFLELGQTKVLDVPAALSVPGDSNFDGNIDVLDIDLLFADIRTDGSNPLFNLDESTVVDEDDVTILVSNFSPGVAET